MYMYLLLGSVAWVKLSPNSRISMSGFQAVSYEYAVEMTYPLPEATSATLLNLVSQVLSIMLLSTIK